MTGGLQTLHSLVQELRASGGLQRLRAHRGRKALAASEREYEAGEAVL